MPNLKETMNRRRKGAINASDQQIAEHIWSLIEVVFDSYEGYELEVFDYITVDMIEKVDCLKLQVITKKSDEIKEETSEVRNIVLSSKKLERLGSIMPLVMELAEKEGAIPWNDVNDDQEKFWGFHMEFKEEDK